MEEKQILDRLWDNYELSFTEASALRKPIESMAKENRLIADLRREISSLGTPNLGAIEEYKRVSERYEFLSTQRDDVEKAKSAARVEHGVLTVTLPKTEQARTKVERQIEIG